MRLPTLGGDTGKLDSSDSDEELRSMIDKILSERADAVQQYSQMELAILGLVATLVVFVGAVAWQILRKMTALEDSIRALSGAGQYRGRREGSPRRVASGESSHKESYRGERPEGAPRRTGSSESHRGRRPEAVPRRTESTDRSNLATRVASGEGSHRESQRGGTNPSRIPSSSSTRRQPGAQSPEMQPVQVPSNEGASAASTARRNGEPTSPCLRRASRGSSTGSTSPATQKLSAAGPMRVSSGGSVSPPARAPSDSGPARAASDDRTSPLSNGRTSPAPRPPRRSRAMWSGSPDRAEHQAKEPVEKPHPPEWSSLNENTDVLSDDMMETIHPASGDAARSPARSPDRSPERHMPRGMTLTRSSSASSMAMMSPENRGISGAHKPVVPPLSQGGIAPFERTSSGGRVGRSMKSIGLTRSMSMAAMNGMDQPARIRSPVHAVSGPPRRVKEPAVPLSSSARFYAQVVANQAAQAQLEARQDYYNSRHGID